MPAASIVEAANALSRGLRTTFIDTYREASRGLDPRVGMVMDLGNPSDKLSELYAYWESTPYPERWDRGENMPTDTFEAVQYTVENVDWAKAIPFHENDLQDDQTGAMLDRARLLATNFATLPERILFQLLLASTDDNLLEAVPNAPDGAAFFAGTAGGAARFGVTNGNVLTGTGVTTVSAIQTDLYSAFSQFKQMQDTEGEPLWNESIIDQGVLVIYGAGNEKVFAEAFAQRVVHSVVSSTGAGVTNILLDGNKRIVPWSTQRITDNDWFVVLTAPITRPCFEQVRMPLRDHLDDYNTSEAARDTKIWKYRVDARMGYGINLPYAAIKINN